MNDKQKQIEEMAKVMCGGCHNGEDCMRCLCADWYRAEMLYDANYRKIPEGSVVISKEEYLQFLKLNSEFISLEKSIPIIKDQARKQAIKEFAEELENRLDSVDIILHEDNDEEYLSFNGVLGLIDEIAKEMGVETTICKNTQKYAKN